MVSRDTWFLTLSLVSAFLVVSMDARSWDLAVAVGQEIDFFSRNGTLTGHSNATGAEMLMGLAYDNVTGTMFTSDTKNEINVLKYAGNVTGTRSDQSPYTMLTQTNESRIIAMVFDPVSRTLFWTDDRKDAVMKTEVPLNGQHSRPEMLHNLKGHNPYGIALDICNRFIYWSNCTKPTVCSIQRSKLDGSDKEVVVNGSMYDVFGLAIDHFSRKLYWVDDIEGVSYQIWRSNLNGSNRELFMNGTQQEPDYIAVDSEAVYWTDRQSISIWKIKKDKGVKDTPEEMKTYYGAEHHPHIASIITWDSVGGIDCDGILKAEENSFQHLTTPKPPIQSLDNVTTSTKRTNPTTPQPENKCMHKGRYNEFTAKCSCKKGYIGAFCEVSVCHNYCVHGSCTVDARGSPECDCGTSYTGDRCERDVCDGYCLNDGTCTTSSTGPYCKCENSWGTRCEYTNELDKLCSVYCTQTEDAINSVSIESCKCSEVNNTLEEQFIAPEPLVQSTIILSVLLTVIGSLVIVVGVLSYHINKLRRRPRIRKRFVVSKGGVTPLTSRPQVPSDSCEITIENCCNMNICETPCFEPKLRATPTKSSSTKVEEKNSLLDSMEGADSC